MKILLFLFLTSWLACSDPADQHFQDGDLIFQTSRSAQSKAIQVATQSPYSHLGIIYHKKGQIFVFEAVQPVTLTPLQTWIARGEQGRYVVKRLKNSARVLDPATLKKMKQIGDSFLGRDYDPAFEWSDEKMYCSELVWKIYQRATGIKIGSLRKLKDFNLESDLVRKKLRERYGHSIPVNEQVISPADMFHSDTLITVAEF